MKRLLFTFKYKPYVSDLHKLLGVLFHEGIIQNEFFMQRKTADSLLLPVPLYRDKLRSRGYNHAALLAQSIGDTLDLSTTNGIVRVKKTKSQFLLKREDRLLNVSGVFALRESTHDWEGKTVFIVDDVVTTGATIREITKLLKRSGAKHVYGLTLAHGQ